MANIAPLNQVRTKVGSGRTGVVLSRIEAAVGYRLTAVRPRPLPEGEVYKVAIEDDRAILDEVLASDVVREAFRAVRRSPKSGDRPVQDDVHMYTPLLPARVMTVTWEKLKPHVTGSSARICLCCEKKPSCIIFIRF